MAVSVCSSSSLGKTRVIEWRKSIEIAGKSIEIAGRSIEIAGRSIEIAGRSKTLT
jgi:hypothetical protein